jgi:tetratricopeptide (TPR) repeat protein
VAILGGATAVVILLTSVYYLSTALERKFDTYMNAGKLVSGDSESAYSVYLRAIQDRGASSSTVQRMNAKARPTLDARSRDLLQMWYRQSDLGNISWDDTARIEDWLNRIDNTPASRAQSEYAAGMVALTHRNGAEALRHLETAASLAPRWAMALNAVGRAHFQLRQFQDAARHYLLATEADPNWCFPHINLANLYRDNLHDDAQAEAHYRRAIELDSNRASFHYSFANLYYRQGKRHYPQACQEYRSALQSSASPLTPREMDVARQRIDKLCR